MSCRRILKTEKNRRNSNCRSDLKGNLLSWENSNWALHNMEVLDYNDDENLCTNQLPGMQLFPEST